MVDDCTSWFYSTSKYSRSRPFSNLPTYNDQQIEIVDDFRHRLETRGNCWQAHTYCGAMGRAAGWLSLALSH